MESEGGDKRREKRKRTGNDLERRVVTLCDSTDEGAANAPVPAAGARAHSAAAGGRGEKGA